MGRASRPWRARSCPTCTAARRGRRPRPAQPMSSQPPRRERGPARRGLRRSSRRAGASCVVEKPDRVAPGRIAHDQRRLGIAEEVIELGERVGGVERQIDRAAARAGEVKQHVRDALLDLDRDPIAAADAQTPEAGGEASAALVEVGVGEAVAAGVSIAMRCRATCARSWISRYRLVMSRGPTRQLGRAALCAPRPGRSHGPRRRPMPAPR